MSGSRRSTVGSSCSRRRWPRSCNKNLTAFGIRSSSGLLEPGGWDRAHGFQPDPAAGDVPNLAGHRERAELVNKDVDPTELAEPQRGRRRHRHPEPVLTHILRPPEEGLVVDPQPDRPGDGKSGVTAALGCRAHCRNRLTGASDRLSKAAANER